MKTTIVDTFHFMSSVSAHQVMRDFSESFDACEGEEGRSRKRSRANHSVRWLMSNETKCPSQPDSSSAVRSAGHNDASDANNRVWATSAVAVAALNADARSGGHLHHAEPEATQTITQQPWGGSVRPPAGGGGAPGTQAVPGGCALSADCRTCTAAASHSSHMDLGGVRNGAEAGTRHSSRASAAVGCKVGVERLRVQGVGIGGRNACGGSEWEQSPQKAAIVTPGEAGFGEQQSEQLEPDSPASMRLKQIELLEDFMKVNGTCMWIIYEICRLVIGGLYAGEWGLYMDNL